MTIISPQSPEATPTDHALHFTCHGRTLIGVLHLPAAPCARGVLVVTGGPQYRIGSHRQFVLLGRRLAADGIAVFRFDYRGMGDSTGAPRRFDAVGDDLRAAADCFFEHLPHMTEVVLWGLCDGATAATFYAGNDRRVAGLVLLNPWVRTNAGWARTNLRHYYLQRLRSGAFWRSLAGGAVDVTASLRSLRALLSLVPSVAARRDRRAPSDLPARLHRALAAFPGPLLIILAGADLGAREFDALATQPRWRQLLAAQRVHRLDIDGANHTFARRAWRDQVAQATAEWLKSW